MNSTLHGTETDRNWNHAGQEKMDYSKQRAFNEYSDSELADGTRETALVAAVIAMVIAMGQICDTRIGYQRNPDACKIRTRGDGRNSWRKKKRRNSRVNERYLDIDQSPEMPEWKRTATPTVLQTLEKRRIAHGAQDQKRGRGGHASG